MTMTTKQLVETIVDILDGTEHDSDTLASIVELLTDAGYTIRDINER